nr:hypothetical protein C1892_22780 [Pseudomonas sp. MPBD7-1]
MIQADSFLLHKKSKTPPQKGGVFTGLDELRRSRTLSVGADECNEAAILIRAIEPQAKTAKIKNKRSQPSAAPTGICA